MSAAAERTPTPGPWEWVDSPAWGYSTLWNASTRQEVLVPGGRNDADTPEVWMGEEMSEADKALIAAAPDLLAALKYIRDMPGPVIDGPTGPCKFLAHPVVADVVNEAIAKAEGR